MLMNMDPVLSPLEALLLGVAIGVICFVILDILDDFDAQ